MDVSFGSKVKPRTFGCFAISSSAVVFIMRSRLILHSEGSGVNRKKPLCRYGCMHFLAALVRVDVMVMSSAILQDLLMMDTFITVDMYIFIIMAFL